MCVTSMKEEVIIKSNYIVHEQYYNFSAASFTLMMCVLTSYSSVLLSVDEILIMLSLDSLLLMNKANI